MNLIDGLRKRRLNTEAFEEQSPICESTHKTAKLILQDQQGDYPTAGHTRDLMSVEMKVSQSKVRYPHSHGEG